MGDICLRLVIVVVGDEVLHRVVREKLLELRAKLSRQGLVVGQHQRGTLHPFDDLGHGIGLSRAGDAQQHLLGKAVFNSPRQSLDRLRLVAGGLIGGYDVKIWHTAPL